MEITAQPELDLPEVDIESSVDLPGTEDYVPCDQCESIVKDGRVISTRSYMFFYFNDGLLSFCKHHGERNQTRLESLGGALVLDTRERLLIKS